MTSKRKSSRKRLKKGEMEPEMSEAGTGVTGPKVKTTAGRQGQSAGALGAGVSGRRREYSTCQPGVVGRRRAGGGNPPRLWWRGSATDRG